MIELKQVGEVWILHFRSGENRFNEEFVGEVNGALDRVEGSQLPTALVTTGTGKFYSNGLDLEWLSSAEDPAGFMDQVHRLLVRLLTFPAVTVAAVNGHAFAAGAMLATAHDFMVMRSDRGYWCLPEVDLGLPLTPTMHALVSARLSPFTLHEAITTGRRYDAAAALAAQIAHHCTLEEQVVPTALSLASELSAKNPEVIARHKQLMYADVVQICPG